MELVIVCNTLGEKNTIHSFQKLKHKQVKKP